MTRSKMSGMINKRTFVLGTVVLGASLFSASVSSAALQTNDSLDFFTNFQEADGNNPSFTITKDGMSVDFVGHIGIRPDGPLYFQDARSFWVEEDNVDGSAMLSDGAVHVQFVARDRVLPGAGDPNGVIEFLDMSDNVIDVDIEVYDALSGVLNAADANHGTDMDNISLSNNWVRYVVTASDDSVLIKSLRMTNDDGVGRSAIDDFGFNVPEPASAALLGLGMLLGLRRQK
ncbi:PEP-CTERM sorting domain-containing protein [Planctomycetota bacterium]|nr:PEP-CTERM sorting domain-containing protein [Planctomycetota bacterium]